MTEVLDSATLQANIRKGLQRDETPFAQSLGHMLDAETVSAGIELKLGDNQDALKRTIDLLGIDSLLSQGALSLTEVSVENSISKGYFGATGRDFVTQHGVADSLTFLQAREWEDIHAGRIWSVIALARLSRDAEGVIPDISHPIVTFGARAIYSATLAKQLREMVTEARHDDRHLDGGSWARLMHNHITELDTTTPVIPLSAIDVSIGPLVRRGQALPRTGKTFLLAKDGTHFTERKAA